MKHTISPRLRRSALTLGALWAAIIASTAIFATPVQAQSPDVRSVPPIILMLIDSSGSMEKVGDCACVTPTCEECLPSCSRSPQRNRWTTVIEALTGSIPGFNCTLQDRAGRGFTGEPDYRYFLPHARIGGISCTDSTLCPPGQTCSADDTTVEGDTGFCQNEDGILDVYRDRAKFGLMTFDATTTFLGEGELMTRTNFLARGGANRNAAGGYSYEDRRAFSFPGCAEPYMIDNGSRNESAPAGRLVSVGLESTDDISAINRDVQGALLAGTMRPYGATPIAGMLTDAEHYLEHHPDTRRISAIGLTGDPFNACRKRYAILVTDGRPTSDMRGAPFFCENLAQPVGESGCPYETPVVQAATMLADGVIDGLYVVGFNVSGDNCPAGDAECLNKATTTVATLNDLAAAGGTTEAIFANDRATLIAALTHIMDEAAPGTTTRTIPAFSAAGGGGVAGSAGQLQFSTGFNLTTEPGMPWTGVLERRRIECDGLVPTPQPIEDRDRFHLLLNSQASTINSAGYSRRLVTVVPRVAGERTGRLTGRGEAEITGALLPVPTDAAPTGIAQDNLQLAEFTPDNLALTPGHLNVASTARRDEIMYWVHGVGGTERADRRLGSIYHSSPIVVAPPSTDILDEGFNLFRQRPEVLGRPTVVYVGTNDGVLHAFVAEDHEFPPGHPRVGQTLTAGEELWGFVPPMLLGDLEGAMDSQVWLVDGTPISRDIFFARAPGAANTGNEYHSILLTGMRGGGNGFIAMDITDPVNPEFLWQYTDSLFGNSYGQPAMGQVLIDINGTVHERGIAVLPGGHGSTRNNGSCDVQAEASASGSDAVPGSGRRSRRCWNNAGRGLAIIDMATGRVLRRWDQRTFPAPLDGGVSVFLGETGTIASSGYVTDADGVIWRIDLSNSDPDRWEVEAFHDMFEGMAYNAGQPAYGAPILSTTNEGDVVVIQGTGDIDRLENYTNVNRVISVTEQTTRDNDTGVLLDVSADLNWRITLDPGEQVTGPIDLFQGSVYFGTFKSTSSPTNACDVGYSRIWGVNYLEDDGSNGPEAALESTAGSGIFDRTFIDPSVDPALTNQIVMGVAVTQRPTCVNGRSVTETDPYVGTRQTFRVDAASQPSFQLVAQLSGGGGGETGASVGEFVRELPPPVAYTESQGYAGTID